jgi:hypothetical protein
LDEADLAYFGSVFPPIVGSVGPEDVLIEYVVGSIDVGVHSRREIRHYEVREGKVERVDPLVLSPRDFLDEWIRRPWAESSRWAEEGARATLEKWHQERSAPSVFGTFVYPTLHCEERPDLWQVGIEFSEAGRQGTTEYSLIRWRPPYHFTMVGVSGRPWPGCTEKDPAADEPRTLYPIQDWR